MNVNSITQNNELFESWEMTVASGFDYHKFPNSKDYAESALIRRVSQLNREELLELMERIVWKPFLGSEWVFDEAFTRFNDLNGQALTERGWVRSVTNKIPTQSPLTAKGADWIFKRRVQREDISTSVNLAEISSVLDKSYLFVQIGPHVQPIYVERQNGKVRLLVTDSLGIEKVCYPLLLRQLQEDHFTGEVYLYTPQRQTSPSNCAVFAIRDLVKIFKRQQLVSEGAIDIFSWVKNHLQKKDLLSSFRVYQCNSLPLEMLKGSHMVSLIETAAASKASLGSVLPRHSPSGEPENIETCIKSVKKHMRSICVTKYGVETENNYNFLISDRAMKYKVKMCQAFVEALYTRSTISKNGAYVALPV